MVGRWIFLWDGPISGANCLFQGGDFVLHFLSCPFFFGKDTVFQIGFPVFVGCEKTSHVAWSLFLSVIGTVLFSSYQSCETPHLNLDGWFHICFIITPKIGKDSHFDEHIFKGDGSTTNYRNSSSLVVFKSWRKLLFVMVTSLGNCVWLTSLGIEVYHITQKIHGRMVDRQNISVWSTLMDAWGID